MSSRFTTDPDVNLKEGDTTPEFTVDLGESFDSGATARFYMEYPPSRHDIGNGELIVNQPVTNFDTEAGEVTYDFGEGRDRTAGRSLCRSSSDACRR